MNRCTTISVFRARTGFSPELARCLDRMAGVSRLEPGCLSYEIRGVDGDPDLWLVHEQWESAEAAEIHFARPYLGRFIDAMVPLIEGDVGISSFMEEEEEAELMAA